MTVEELKKLLAELVDEIDSEDVFLGQQKITKGNLYIYGRNGRLFIQPLSEEIDVSLSGISLVEEMYPFMKRLCGRDCDDFKHRNKKNPKSRQPYWRVRDFDLVREAVYRYSKTMK